jgi:hypothetical protein
MSVRAADPCALNQKCFFVAKFVALPSIGANPARATSTETLNRHYFYTSEIRSHINKHHNNEKFNCYN